MFQCGRVTCRQGIAVLAAVLAFASSAGAAAAELRTVLGTGDDVPGFGRIGVRGLHLAGLDDRGRALVSAAKPSAKIARGPARAFLRHWSCRTTPATSSCGAPH